MTLPGSRTWTPVHWPPPRRPVTADLAECGYCGISAPDEFGNRDLLVHSECPWHGEGTC